MNIKSLLIIPLVIILALLSLACLSDDVEVTGEAEIISATSIMEVTGTTGSLLWSGSINSEIYYFFYLRNDDNSIQLHKTQAIDSRVFVIEDPNITKDTAFVRATFIWNQLTAHGEKQPSGMLNLSRFSNFTIREDGYWLKKLEITVPEGTITKSLELNLGQ